MELKDRFVGGIVGVHVGDAIGAPYETWTPTAISADIEKRKGLTFFDYPNPWAKDGNGKTLPIGRPTDDSDQTADLAWSLTECGGLCTEHLREALRDSVVRNKSRLWAGKATGAGGTTKKTLSDDPALVDEGLRNNIGTNGSLMRCLPLSLWLFPEIEGWTPETEIYEAIREMSAVTHAHPHAVDACYVYTKVVHTLLTDRSIYDIDFSAAETSLPYRVYARLGDSYDFPYDPGAWPMRGTAEFSLYVALYALERATTFADGIEIAVRVGGDTDTYAAIAGGLLGVKFGYWGIPEEWRLSIFGHDPMSNYAKRIYQMRIG